MKTAKDTSNSDDPGTVPDIIGDACDSVEKPARPEKAEQSSDKLQGLEEMQVLQKSILEKLNEITMNQSKVDGSTKSNPWLQE